MPKKDRSNSWKPNLSQFETSIIIVQTEYLLWEIRKDSDEAWLDWDFDGTVEALLARKLIKNEGNIIKFNQVWTVMHF